MAEESDPERDAIHDAIQANADHVMQATGGAVLTGWVVVSEWINKDGDRFLGWCRADSTTSWTARGMMAEIMAGPDKED